MPSEVKFYKNRIEWKHLYDAKLIQHPLIHLKRGSSWACQVLIQIIKHPLSEIYCVASYASPNKYVFNWLQKHVIVCCEWTDCGSTFHSVGEAIAKPHLPMACLGQADERDSRFP